MNLEDANRAKAFVLMVRHDTQKRVVRAMVPGHKAKMYEVDIERDLTGWTCECREVAHYDIAQDKLVEQFQDCAGVQFGVCYHCLAVFLASIDKQGSAAFFEGQDDAEERLAIQDPDKSKGMRVVRLASKCAPRKAVWAVFTPTHPPKRKVQPQPAASTKGQAA